VWTLRDLRPDLPSHVGDVTDLDLPDGNYAACISLDAVERHQQGLEPFLSEAYRALSGDGVVLVSVPCFNPPGRAKAHLGLHRGCIDGLSSCNTLS